jgi:hypothetical protein
MFDEEGDGSLVLTSLVTTFVEYIYVSTGEFTHSGASLTIPDYLVSGTGTGIFSGDTGEPAITGIVIGVGTLNVNGTSPQTATYIYTGSGDVLSLVGYGFVRKTEVPTPLPVTAIQLAGSPSGGVNFRVLPLVYSAGAAKNAWYSRQNTAYLSATTAQRLRKIRKEKVPSGTTVDSTTVVVD